MRLLCDRVIRTKKNCKEYNTSPVRNGFDRAGDYFDKILSSYQANVFKHDYLNELRAERSPQFIESYNAYKHKYRLADFG